MGLRWEFHPEALLSVVGEPAGRRQSLIGLLAPSAAPPRLRIPRRVCAVSARPAVMGCPSGWVAAGRRRGPTRVCVCSAPPAVISIFIIFLDGSLSDLAVGGIAATAVNFRGDQARRR